VVARAATAGVELLALSDHDTVGGVDEALETARRHGIRLVPAAELSALYGPHEDLHVLGYGLDHYDPALTDALQSYRADRVVRAEAMIAALRELGFELDDEAFAARRRAGRAIGRPHIARAAFEHPANAPRIAQEGLADSSKLLEAYLIDGAPAFRPRTRPTVEEAIEVIHAAGGVAVWAHPFWDVDADDEALAAIDRFHAAGLDGVEAFYITHTREQTILLADRCAELGLLTTGSADFHGPDHPRFHAFRAFELHGREPRLGPIADTQR
jgi:predicted metal-dependent phosphoesterase TrpH